MSQPEIAVVVSTFERPDHLRRSLASLAAQQGVDGRFEVVVTDDGSRDETAILVEKFARRVNFRLTFTTHIHTGFRLARCRNSGISATTAPYILFTDGDCLLPPDHLRRHLERRRTGWVVGGDCCRLDEATTARITVETVRSGEYLRWIPPAEKWRLWGKSVRARLYTFLRRPMLPRLTGNNIAVWRSDLERINGFDEAFVGWGLEDRDLQLRLSRLGLRVRTILDQTAGCHLWHPPTPSFARNGEGTANLAYFRRRDVPTYCADGLRKSASPCRTV